MSNGPAHPPYWTIAAYTVGAVVSVVLVWQGLSSGNDAVAAAGALGLIVVLAGAPIAGLMRRGGGGGSDGSVGVRLDRIEKAVREMNEQAGLSDDARRVLNRGRERDLLRKAIEEDIAAEDWDAAMVLVKELAERFGYRADAEQFRTRIETSRFRVVDKRVVEAVEGLDRMITQLRWDEARMEAERITRLYPDSSRVEGLRHRVEAARARYKGDLERRFLVAAEHERIDEAMDLLVQLDNYLTEPEAEPYRELARGVIGKARENLGVQFKMAVQDRAWDRAAELGERIIEDFPNTRMADEIRGMIDSLRERAMGMRTGV